MERVTEVEARAAEGRLRVLYLIDSLGPGGAQRQFVTLVNALERRYVEPEVAVYHRLDHFLPELERTGTPVHQLGTRGGRDPGVVVRLALLVRRREYGLIHTRLKTSGVLARVATLAGRRPPIVLSEGGLNLSQSRWRIAAEKALAGRADAMIVNADAIRRQLETLVPALKGRIHLVPSGIDWGDPGRETLAAAGEFRADCLGDGGDILLGVVARLNRVKDPHHLLDALELVAESALGRIRVVWVGAWNDERLAESVRSRVHGGRLRGRFRLLPPTRAVRPVYLALDALVLTSSSEGLPSVVLEALWDGTPVVATDVGDVGEVVRAGENGWLVPSRDPGALAAAIEDIVATAPDRRKQMGAAGAAFVRQDYSAERLAERTMAVYRHVLGLSRTSKRKGGRA